MVRAEWIAVIESLELALTSFGRQGQCGDGDFSIADEDWGDERVDLLVSDQTMLARPVLEAIAKVLRDHDAFYVVISRKAPDGSVREDVAEVTPSGFRVHL